MDIRRRMLFKKKASSGGGSTTGGSYTVNLNNQWEKTTTVTNPDSTLYDGVYRSSSNYNVDSGVATMYITIKDCSSFKMYIRSYAESNYDYVMVSQLDKTINGNTTYSDTTLVKAHTRGDQQSGTALSNYTLVEFTGITSGEHTITVVYRKDSSVNNGDDRGYVLIEKSQAGSGDSGGDDEGGSSEGAINIDNYLTIEARENGLTASLSTNACEYCVDGDGNWKSLAAGTATESINSGHTLSFRGNITPTSSAGIGTFTISKKCNLKGNCMSMLFGDNAANNYSLSGKDRVFYKLFYNCTNIVTVSSNFLPATTLTKYCYRDMFRGCTSLTTAPELPATTLADSCYYYMFYDCKNLTTTPVLPATTLTNCCYLHMFQNCTSLTTPPVLPATTLATSCYNSMFYNCKNLTTTPVLPATTLANYCYESMFNGCTSLTTPPVLPATKLASQCYQSMFRDCINLTTTPELPATTLADFCYYAMFVNTNVLPDCSNIDFTSNTVVASGGLKGLFYGTKVTDNDLERLLPKNSNGRYYLPATTLANNCYSDMFRGCTSLTTAPELPATTLANNCYEYMFDGCTSLTTAPELPATTLASQCYDYMFKYCNKLNYIKMLATDVSASNCLRGWVYGISSTGTFVKNPDMTSLPTGISGIPSGWTVVDDGEESGGNLITFTIDGTEYQAEEGMTWEEWCNSDYNVNNYEYDEWGVYCKGVASYLSLFYSNEEIVGVSDIIISTHAYFFSD